MNTVRALFEALHVDPELSGGEQRTANRIVDFFEPLEPDSIVTGLGGHGVAVVFDPPPSAERPRSILLRCELDALPIAEAERMTDSRSGERASLPVSKHPGIAHLCGHDGHMAILAGVGQRLAAARRVAGSARRSSSLGQDSSSDRRDHSPNARVTLLFQPAEEDGSGAAAVLADERWERLRPDVAFALHNLPGFPRGRVLLRSGTICCASTGLMLSLNGRPAHAAQPETGINPAQLVAKILQTAIDDWSSSRENFVTVVGADLGGHSFGTAAGEARVRLTARSDTDAGLEGLVARVRAETRELASVAGIEITMDSCDGFAATVNDERQVEFVRRALSGGTGFENELGCLSQPFRWSEDFGRFLVEVPGALLGLGSGEDCMPLHDPEYVFPTDLIETAVDLWWRLLHREPLA